MTRKEVEKRLSELGLYRTYYMRQELKLLPQVLADSEVLNCILTGIHEGSRKMLAVTDHRLLLLSCLPLTKAGAEVIPKEAITGWCFDRKLLRSSVSVTYGDAVLRLTATQSAVADSFNQAMQCLMKP